MVCFLCGLAAENKITEAVVRFLEEKYGLVVVEVSRIYRRGDVFEVAGSFRIREDRRWRRFTFLIDSKDYSVKGFGLR